MARKTEPTASGRMPMMEQVMKCYRVVAQTERRRKILRPQQRQTKPLVEL